MVIELERRFDIETKLKEVAFNSYVDVPKVSVIVPTYNNEKYLPKCLFSLIEQTLKDIEIIVVNDGSTDNSLPVLNLFSKYDKRIKIINQEHLMQGAARNTGLKEANGEYVGFVDSDDWIDLDYFKKLYDAAKKYDSDIALATNVRIGNGKTKKRLNIKEERFVTSLQDKIDISNQVKNPCPTNKIYKTSMLSGNNIIWEENCYCEDRMFTIQALYYSNGLVAVPDVNYYYFRNPTSTVNRSGNEHRKKLIEDKNSANLRVLNFLKEKDAQVRDKEFWSVAKKLQLFNIPILVKKQSLHTVKCYLFGFVKIFEGSLS